MYEYSPFLLLVKNNPKASMQAEFPLTIQHTVRSTLCMTVVDYIKPSEDDICTKITANLYGSDMMLLHL